jgi:hypothetical protein
MSSRKNNRGSALSRRNWLVLASAALAGCGGGSVGVGTAGLPGTGGTGIYVQGSISGFGSVIVNGIKFDDRLAKVQVDGVAATALDLRLGMVAGVQGERDAVTKLGTASVIDIWSIAQGRVNQTLAGEFKVAGMTVLTDNATVFDGISSGAALATGQRVTVWGLQTGADARTWKATRVAVEPGTATATAVSTGLINGVGAQRTLNGLLLAGQVASSLSVGQLVRAQGTLSADGTGLALTSVLVKNAGLVLQPQGKVEIEGFVATWPPVGGRFMLGGIEVDVSSASVRPASAKVTLGARVEVYGTWQQGVLKATEVELEDEEVLHDVEIEAKIEQFTSVADFVLRGQRCDASRAIFSHGTAANLRVGVKVKVKGTKAGGDVLMAVELEFDH